MAAREDNAIPHWTGTRHWDPREAELVSPSNPPEEWIHDPDRWAYANHYQQLKAEGDVSLACTKSPLRRDGKLWEGREPNGSSQRPFPLKASEPGGSVLGFFGEFRREVQALRARNRAQ